MSKSPVGGQESMSPREDGNRQNSSSNTGSISGNHKKKEWILSDMQVKQFLQEGYLVIEDVLSDDELKIATEGFRKTLWEMAGVDIHNLEGTGKHLSQLSSTNGSGGVLDIFYPAWKLQLQTNPKLFSIISQLWYAMYCRSSTYHLSNNNKEEEEEDNLSYRCHPFLSEEMNDEFCCTTGYVHIDRVGYRLPTKLAQQLGKSKKRPLQRSLTPHLDCCPDTFYDTSHTHKTMWRPIQCFVSLTDTETSNTGGLELVPKFHRNFHQWIHNRPLTASDTTTTISNDSSHKSLCFGEYTHLRPMEDREVMKQIQHIPVKAKSMVLWDYRLPHANSYRNDCNIPRSVVYCSFLPNVPLNQAYVENLESMLAAMTTTSAER